MPAPDWEDLGDFLNLDDFAIEAEIAFSAGGTRTIRAIFDDPYAAPALGELTLDSTGPTVSGRESDFAGVGRGDTVTVAGALYDVLQGAEGDGTGWARLPLAPRHGAAT